MVRINLLPREILERRKYERFYPYVFIVGGVLLAIVLFAFLALQFTVNAKREELQQTQQNAEQLRSQAEDFSIFEQKEQELLARQEIANLALAGRIPVGVRAEEVSMVLPEQIWLQRMVIDQSEGLRLNGYTPGSMPVESDSDMNESFKSLAAVLVRVNELPEFFDCWLTNASFALFGAFDETLYPDGGDADTIEFEATAKVSRPPTPTVESAAPAPPSASENQ